MKLINTIALGVILALPAVAGPGVAHAQNQPNWLSGVQGLLNGNNNGDQRAYEQGRQDEWRQQQAERQRERWRAEHSGQEYGYGGPGYGHYGSNNGPSYDQGYQPDNGYSR